MSHVWLASHPDVLHGKNFWTLDITRKLFNQMFSYLPCLKAPLILFFFFFYIPQLYLWGLPVSARFLHMWPFSDPTIEVVTFCLRGWCMLGVLLLPTVTHLGHNCQDLSSPCMECICAQTRPWFVLSSERVLNGMGVRTHVNSKGKKSPLPEAQRRF